ncbi:hypothetical protein B0H13DRAFT_413880 [Mycena leptocephala]|nr:hypothetical protein B0H13DRAFT_413880 [Mycena leptocephala]
MLTPEDALSASAGEDPPYIRLLWTGSGGGRAENAALPPPGPRFPLQSTTHLPSQIPRLPALARQPPCRTCPLSIIRRHCSRWTLKRVMGTQGIIHMSVFCGRGAVEGPPDSTPTHLSSGLSPGTRSTPCRTRSLSPASRQEIHEWARFLRPSPIPTLYPPVVMGDVLRVFLLLAVMSPSSAALLPIAGPPIRTLDEGEERMRACPHIELTLERVRALFGTLSSQTIASSFLPLFVSTSQNAREAVVRIQMRNDMHVQRMPRLCPRRVVLSRSAP